MPRAQPEPALDDLRIGHKEAVDDRGFKWASDEPGSPHPLFKRARLRPAGFVISTDLEQYGIVAQPRKE